MMRAEFERISPYLLLKHPRSKADARQTAVHCPTFESNPWSMVSPAEYIERFLYQWTEK